MNFKAKRGNMNRTLKFTANSPDPKFTANSPLGFPWDFGGGPQTKHKNKKFTKFSMAALKHLKKHKAGLGRYTPR